MAKKTTEITKAKADIDFEKVKTEFYKYRESKYRARKAHSRL